MVRVFWNESKKCESFNSEQNGHFLSYLRLLFGQSEVRWGPRERNYLCYLQLAKFLRITFPYEPNVEYPELDHQKPSLESVLSRDLGKATLGIAQFIRETIRDEEYNRTPFTITRESVEQRIFYGCIPSARYSYYRGLVKNPRQDILGWFLASDFPQEDEEFLSLLEEASHAPQGLYVIPLLREYHTKGKKLEPEAASIILGILLMNDRIPEVREFLGWYGEKAKKFFEPAIYHLRSLKGIEIVLGLLGLTPRELGARSLEGEYVLYERKKEIAQALHENLEIPIDHLIDRWSDYFQGEAFKYLIEKVNEPSNIYFEKILLDLLALDTTDENIQVLYEIHPHIFTGPLEVIRFVGEFYLHTEFRVKLYLSLFYDNSTLKVDSVEYLLNGCQASDVPAVMRETYFRCPNFYKNRDAHYLSRHIIVTNLFRAISYYCITEFKISIDPIIEIIRFLKENAPIFEEKYTQFIQKLNNNPKTKEIVPILIEKGLVEEKSGTS